MVSFAGRFFALEVRINASARKLIAIFVDMLDGYATVLNLSQAEIYWKVGTSQWVLPVRRRRSAMTDRQPRWALASDPGRTLRLLGLLWLRRSLRHDTPRRAVRVAPLPAEGPPVRTIPASGRRPYHPSFVPAQPTGVIIAGRPMDGSSEKYYRKLLSQPTNQPVKAKQLLKSLLKNNSFKKKL